VVWGHKIPILGKKWYQPFFNALLAKWPGIRGFNYINRLNIGHAAAYGDCRIESSKFGLGEKYRSVLENGLLDGATFLNGFKNLSATCMALGVHNCSAK